MKNIFIVACVGTAGKFRLKEKIYRKDYNDKKNKDRRQSKKSNNTLEKANATTVAQELKILVIASSKVTFFDTCNST